MINNRHTGIVVPFSQLLLACLNPAPAQGASQEDEVRKAVSAFDRAYSVHHSLTLAVMTMGTKEKSLCADRKNKAHVV